jgi:hypothetical protein
MPKRCDSWPGGINVIPEKLRAAMIEDSISQAIATFVPPAPDRGRPAPIDPRYFLRSCRELAGPPDRARSYLPLHLPSAAKTTIRDRATQHARIFPARAMARCNDGEFQSRRIAGLEISPCRAQFPSAPPLRWPPQQFPAEQFPSISTSARPKSCGSPRSTACSIKSGT